MLQHAAHGATNQVNHGDEVGLVPLAARALRGRRELSYHAFELPPIVGQT